MKKVLARAYANIALVKYWGKHTVRGNGPATPSISLCLDALQTDTEVSRIKNDFDEVYLDNKVADEKTTKRIVSYLDIWRKEKILKDHFRISSVNSFPTASGLASSASGFAALATALAPFAEIIISRTQLSQWARMGSGSAARSVPGGISALPSGGNPSARKVIGYQDVPWGMVVCVVDAPSKDVGSTEGMILSSKTSPYYNAWVKTAKTDYSLMLKSLKEGDFTSVGKITEENALAMHSCMIATRPSLVYWSGVTIELLHAVKIWRKNGLETYATIDAGPHVVFLAKRSDLNRVESEAKKIDGVLNTFIANPAPGAEVISWE